MSRVAILQAGMHSVKDSLYAVRRQTDTAPISFSLSCAILPIRTEAHAPWLAVW